MSESLRDRVAREVEPILRGRRPLTDAHTLRADAYAVADALIAAGLVAEPEWEYGVKWLGSGAEPVEHATREPWRTANDAVRYAEEDDSIVRRRTYKPGEWGDAPS